MSSVKSSFFGGAAGKAGEAAAAASMAGVKEQKRQFNITQKNFQPFLEAGTAALSKQQQFLGLGGVAEQQQAFADFQESPGQKFLRERQERALINNQTAIGGIGGGNIRTALQEQAAGIASTQLGDFQNRLAGIAGGGQTATTSLGNIGAQTSSSIAQGLQAAGQATASGITGQAAGMRAGIGQVAQGIGFFSDERLKTNIVKIDELASGLNWYCWDWIESAKEMVGDQPRSGVIAQEAQKLFPNAISHKFGYLTVNYRSIH